MPSISHTHAGTPRPEDIPRQRFDNFIGNAKHKLVLMALRELALGSPEATNPVVLCGGSGTGKSHLLYAFTLALPHKNGHAAPAAVLKADELAGRIMTADKNGSTLALKTELLGDGALVVDDIHTVQSPRVHEALAGILDAFLAAGRPVAVAGTGLPTEWPLTRSLSSRLRAGLLLELPEPDLDISLRFLDAKLREANVTLPRDGQLLLARNCHDLRRLTGIVKRLAAQRRLTGNNVTEAELEALLTQHGEMPELNHGVITALVASRFSIAPEELSGRDRHPERVKARQIAMFLCRKLLGLSYPAIGALFNGKDHSTVIHAVKKINELQRSNSDTNKLVTELIQQCQSYRQ